MDFPHRFHAPRSSSHSHSHHSDGYPSGTHTRSLWKSLVLLYKNYHSAYDRPSHCAESYSGNSHMFRKDLSLIYYSSIFPVYFLADCRFSQNAPPGTAPKRTVSTDKPVYQINIKTFI